MPIEHRHYSDELFLSLQTREAAYNVPLLDWNATTATRMTDVDDATVHELWDDAIVGADLVRVGARLPARQARTQHSVRVPVTHPRVTLHALAGLVGLSLGQVATTQQPLRPSYRHRLTLAAPTQLPSISAQIGHLQNVYAIYGGIKSESFVLKDNGPYLSLTTHLIGSGSRLDVTEAVHGGSGLVTAGTPPDAWQLTDSDGGAWYVSPDGAGGLVIDTVPPAGVVLTVGLGLALLAVNGTRYRIGIAPDGTLAVSVVSTLEPPRLEVAALRDSTGGFWYVWTEEGFLTLDATFPTGIAVVGDVPRLEEPWLRWGQGRLWLADVTETPVTVPNILTQGAPNIGPGAFEVSSRTLGLAVAGDNHFLASTAYRVGGGNVRSNFHAAAQALTVTLQLEVDLAHEAADLAAYLDQRILAFEWQCLGDVLAPVDAVLINPGPPPDWQQVEESTGGTWYLGVSVLGQLTVTGILPAGTGLAVGRGLELLAADGWRYRVGVDPLGGYVVTQTVFVGTIPPPVVEVLALRDPSGATWYVWPDGVGGVAVSATLPGFPHSLVTLGTPPAWQQVDGGPVYVGIDTLGELIVTDTLPAGAGLRGGPAPELLALDGWRYRLGADALGELLLRQTVFVGTTPPLVVEVLALRDPGGTTWYIWPDGLGGVTASTALPDFDSWRRGFAWVFPRLQWRALVRTTQQQQDVLELTGTVEEVPSAEAVVLDVWNAQPGYLQQVA